MLAVPYAELAKFSACRSGLEFGFWSHVCISVENDRDRSSRFCFLMQVGKRMQIFRVAIKLLRTHRMTQSIGRI